MAIDRSLKLGIEYADSFAEACHILKNVWRIDINDNSTTESFCRVAILKDGRAVRQCEIEREYKEIKIDEQSTNHVLYTYLDNIEYSNEIKDEIGEECILKRGIQK